MLILKIFLRSLCGFGNNFDLIGFERFGLNYGHYDVVILLSLADLFQILRKIKFYVVFKNK